MSCLYAQQQSINQDALQADKRESGGRIKHTVLYHSRLTTLNHGCVCN